MVSNGVRNVLDEPAKQLGEIYCWSNRRKHIARVN